MNFPAIYFIFATGMILLGILDPGNHPSGKVEWLLVGFIWIASGLCLLNRMRKGNKNESY